MCNVKFFREHPSRAICCHSDILGDVFRFTTRRELAELERTNRNIHGIIDAWLSDTPFLVFTAAYEYEAATKSFSHIFTSLYTEFTPVENPPCVQHLYVSLSLIPIEIESGEEAAATRDCHKLVNSF